MTVDAAKSRIDREPRYMTAQYVPKCLRVVSSSENRIEIQVRALTLLGTILLTIGILATIFVPPAVWASVVVQGRSYEPQMATFVSVIVAIVLIGLTGFVGWKTFGGRIVITPEAVTIGKRMYHMADTNGFRDYQDAGWALQQLRLLKADFLGISYGIYSMRTPFILSGSEASKAAVFLSGLMKQVSENHGHERALKEQQATKF